MTINHGDRGIERQHGLAMEYDNSFASSVSGLHKFNEVILPLAVRTNCKRTGRKFEKDSELRIPPLQTLPQTPPYLFESEHRAK